MSFYDHLAWGITLFCAFMSAWTANSYFRNKLRLFTVMALFSLAWSILLLFYGDRVPHSEIISAYGGFLMVYIGGLLVLESKEESPEPKLTVTVEVLQKRALWLLGLLALPGVPKLVEIYGGLVNREQLETIISTVMDICGFICVIHGFSRLTAAKSGGSRLLRNLLLVVVLFYSLSELAYALLRWKSIGPDDQSNLEWYFYLAFAGDKLALTLLLCYGLARLTYPDRAKNFGQFLVELFKSQ